MLLLLELLLRRLVPAAASRPCGLVAMARAAPCSEDLLRHVQIAARERNRLAHEPDAQHCNDGEAFFRAYRATLTGLQALEPASTAPGVPGRPSVTAQRCHEVASLVVCTWAGTREKGVPVTAHTVMVWQGACGLRRTQRFDSFKDRGFISSIPTKIVAQAQAT